MARPSFKVLLVAIALIMTAATATRAETLPIMTGWTEAERWAWTQIRIGRVADFNARYREMLDPDTPGGWDNARSKKDRRLSAFFLSTLFLNVSLRQSIPGQNIAIAGAWFPEGIQLDRVQSQGMLIIRYSRLEGTLQLQAARVKDILLQNVTANKAVSFDSTEINGMLRVDGGHFIGPVRMTKLKVDGQITMDSAVPW